MMEPFDRLADALAFGSGAEVHNLAVMLWILRRRLRSAEMLTLRALSHRLRSEKVIVERASGRERLRDLVGTGLGPLFMGRVNSLSADRQLDNFMWPEITPRNFPPGIPRAHRAS